MISPSSVLVLILVPIVIEFNPCPDRRPDLCRFLSSSAQAVEVLAEEDPALRATLRSELLRASDATTRARLWRAWARARWAVLPGFGEADAAALHGSFGDPDVVIAWDRAMDRHGPGLVRAAAELSHSPGLADTAARALARMAARYSAEELAPALGEAVSAGGDAAVYRGLLRAAGDVAADAIALHRLADTSARCGWADEARALARGGFRRFGGAEFAGVARGTLDDAAAAESFWREFDRLGRDRSSQVSGRDWLFFLHVAQGAGAAARVAGRVPAADGHRWAPDDLRQAVELLLEMDLAGDAMRLIEGLESPGALYLRARIARAAPGVGLDPVALRRRAIETAARARDDAEGEVWRLAEWMEAGDDAPEDAWTALLELAGPDSAPAANAALRLAQLREREERWDEALALYDRALRVARQPGGAVWIRTDDGRRGDGRAWLEERIRNLRQRMQSGPPPAE
jgi:tetratricopeptide (TPR) repeat protein